MVPFLTREVRLQVRILERAPVPREDLVAQPASDLREEPLDVVVAQLACRELFVAPRLDRLYDLDVGLLDLRQLGDGKARPRRVPRLILEVAAEPRRLEATAMPRVDLVAEDS